MPHVLIDVPVYEPGLAAIQAIPGVTVEVLKPEARSRELKAERLAETGVLFASHAPANLSGMTSLRWLQIASAGYSHLFGFDLAARGIAVTNARGCFDVPIAEWNIAMMINLARDLRSMIRNQDAAVWEVSAAFQREIRGMTVGIWGYGGIGRETARLARALGMRVEVLTRSGVSPRNEVYAVPGTGDPKGELPHRVWRKGEEIRFLEGLDFLIVAMPLTSATEGRIGEIELRALPRTAWVLNPARGPIIQERALLRALDEGWIAGAALDTHYAYPLPAEHPLWRYPNVILTPHISGSTLSQHFGERLWDIFAGNLSRFIRGAGLLNLLTPAQLNGE
jgi:phosphoglycerate dehydrogenase-like enzyme